VAGPFRPNNASVVLELVAATLKLNGVKVVEPMFVSEKIVVGPNITKGSPGIPTRPSEGSLGPRALRFSLGPAR
jgi:hypothetical protein